MNRIKNALERKMLAGKKDEGFSLIELLVVVIIIGILAAIAIPIYLGVQNNAKDSAAQADLSNAKTALVAFATANPTLSAVPATGTPLAAYGYNGPSTNVDAIVFSAVNLKQNFCIQTKRTDGAATDIFSTTAEGNVKKGACA